MGWISIELKNIGARLFELEALLQWTKTLIMLRFDSLHFLPFGKDGRYGFSLEKCRYSESLKMIAHLDYYYWKGRAMNDRPAIHFHNETGVGSRFTHTNYIQKTTMKIAAFANCIDWTYYDISKPHRWHTDECNCSFHLIIEMIWKKLFHIIVSASFELNVAVPWYINI